MFILIFILSKEIFYEINVQVLLNFNVFTWKIKFVRKISQKPDLKVKSLMNCTSLFTKKMLWQNHTVYNFENMCCFGFTRKQVGTLICSTLGN